METCLLEMKNIRKRFPGVYALKGVSLRLHEGEVNAVVGENGAGKSTLINILGGIHHMDEGEILIDGKDAGIDGVLAARNAGINIIHQELVLVPYLSVAENIFINREPRKNGFVDYKEMYTEAQRFIDELGLNIRADDMVAGMSVAQRQMVEIIKAVSFNARIIVMDEPTSSLSDKEIAALFRNIKVLKERGIGIIYISHRLNELAEIADTVTVLRDGESIVTKNIREISNEEIVKYMVGREVTNYYTREFNVPGGTVLEVKGLASEKVRNVSFSLRAGEILGFAGIVGAGRTETIKAILGLDKRTSGEITINGRTAAIKRPVDAYNLGIGFIPESRREESIFPEKSVKFNLVIKVLSEFISGARVSFVKEKEITDTYIKKLSVKTASHNALIKNLSGGNQQKVVIASWLAAKPKILIMDEPTRGIDVGAKAEIYALMNALAREGIGIIMISSELPEIINMSDRVLVMKDGEITRELSREEISQETIMRYAVDI
jgi:ABC-type sugar transport system ATPase subunit